MKRRFVIGLAALALAGVLVAATLAMTPSMAQDNDEDNGFIASSIEDSWGFSAQGVSLPQDDHEPIHGASVGLFSFDGKGACSYSFTRNFGGTSATGTAEACTYEVHPEGTGTITLTIESEEEALSFVIVDNKKEFRFTP